MIRHHSLVCRCGIADFIVYILRSGKRFIHWIESATLSTTEAWLGVFDFGLFLFNFLLLYFSLSMPSKIHLLVLNP